MNSSLLEHSKSLSLCDPNNRIKQSVSVTCLCQVWKMSIYAKRRFPRLRGIEENWHLVPHYMIQLCMYLLLWETQTQVDQDWYVSRGRFLFIHKDFQRKTKNSRKNVSWPRTRNKLEFCLIKANLLLGDNNIIATYVFRVFKLRSSCSVSGFNLMRNDRY